MIFLNGCDYLDEMFAMKRNNIIYDTNNTNSSNTNELQFKLSNEDTLILDNDSYDPDYIPLVLNAIEEHKRGNVNVGLIIVSEDGLSDKTNMLYRSILDKFNSNIPVTLAHGTSDRAFRSKLTNNLENYTDIINDSSIEDAIEVLENKLESQEDKTVTYATGGKLIFLSKFLSNPQRLELFKLKVKELIIGMGCNPLDKKCSREFNLAATDKAYRATKDVYSKLHGRIPFGVIDDKRGDIKKIRALDIFKNANIPLMHHLLGTNIYGTYGDHHAGDVEILFSQSRKEMFNKYRCNVKLENKALKAYIDKNGKDYVYINKGLNINSSTKSNYQRLINSVQ